VLDPTDESHAVSWIGRPRRRNGVLLARRRGRDCRAWIGCDDITALTELARRLSRDEELTAGQEVGTMCHLRCTTRLASERVYRGRWPRNTVNPADTLTSSETEPGEVEGDQAAAFLGPRE